MIANSWPVERRRLVHHPEGLSNFNMLSADPRVSSVAYTTEAPLYADAWFHVLKHRSVVSAGALPNTVLRSMLVTFFKPNHGWFSTSTDLGLSTRWRFRGIFFWNLFYFSILSP